MSDTLRRHWTMLRLVPKAPRKATADEICRRLRDHGYRVSKRTVERDLEKLSANFPLLADTRNRPFGWQWAKQAPLLDLPGMDATTALSFHFIGAYLKSAMPATLRATLKRYIELADRTLDSQTTTGLKRWRDKVRVIPTGQPLLAPKVDTKVMETVYEAVLAERRIEIDYRPQRTGGKPVEYTASPLGLVVRDRVTYVVATLFDYDDIKQLALHRIKNAALIDYPAIPPKGFRLKDYVEAGAFNYPVGDMIKLVARFDRDAAFHLYDTPLSEDQVVTELDDDSVRITATVQDSDQLRWWLLGFGSKVSVELPKKLIQELEEY